MVSHPEMERLSPTTYCALRVPVGSLLLPSLARCLVTLPCPLGPAVGGHQLATGPRRALCPLGPKNSQAAGWPPLLLVLCWTSWWSLFGELFL